MPACTQPEAEQTKKWGGTHFELTLLYIFTLTDKWFNFNDFGLEM